jgi:RNA 2',3'-cyclic 3'-phosphodiesterase
MLRLFVAVDLPAGLRDEVARLMAPVHNARWVNPKQLHITLRFLGETPEAALPDLQQRLHGVKRDQFRLRLRGAGTFPEARPGKRPRPPKVLWLGIEPAAELVALKQAVDAALDGGLTRDNQVFSPHLTLARFPNPPGQTLSAFLTKNQPYTSLDWSVESLHLYQSTLRQEGAIHALLASYPLAQPRPRE